MKKQITLKKMALLVVVLLWGIAANATVKITVSSDAEAAGVNYNTIQKAYDYVKALPSLADKYVIEIQNSYDPTSGVTLETFPITLAANNATQTNDITIIPATGVKKVIGPTNQTTQFTASAAQVTKFTVASITSSTGTTISTTSKIVGTGIAANTTVTGVDVTNKILTLSAAATTAVSNLACASPASFTTTNTATTTTTSLTVADVTNISVGCTITGAGVQTSTTVNAINSVTKVLTLSKAPTLNSTGVTLTFTAAPGTTTGSASTTSALTVTALTNIGIGNYIIGAGITAGTTVTAINETTKVLTLSAAVNVANSVALTFGTYVATPTAITNTVAVNYLYGPAIASGTNYVSGIGSYIAGTFLTTSTTGLGSGSGTLNLSANGCNFASGARIFVGPAQTCAFKFNNAKYVTIDGVSRTDANTGLTIQNPNLIFAQTVYFAGNSQSNTVKNCFIRGANQTGAWNNGYQGTVFFQAGATPTGNICSYNTIDNNDVCDMNDANIPFPICAFQMSVLLASGTTTNQTISNNNIYKISVLHSLWTLSSNICLHPKTANMRSLPMQKVLSRR